MKKSGQEQRKKFRDAVRCLPQGYILQAVNDKKGEDSGRKLPVRTKKNKGKKKDCHGSGGTEQNEHGLLP